MTGLSIAVLGAGAWGSTLASLLANRGIQVRLWDQSAELLEQLGATRVLPHVPELRIPPTVLMAPSIDVALAEASVAVVVIPAQGVRGLCRLVKESGATPDIVLASKGLERGSLKPLTTVVEEELPRVRVGVISGPCIAREVARGVPTSVVAASTDAGFAKNIRDWFVTPTFRIYTQDDVLGVELGGALKNVIAIAAGAGDGLGFGDNSKCALLARGLDEMTRLAVSLGAQARTMTGLAGLGDLAVTCVSPHSRNRQFGEWLARGKTPAEAMEQIGMVVEGVSTAEAALGVAQRNGVDAPITEVVHLLSTGQVSARAGVERLMQRELRAEFR